MASALQDEMATVLKEEIDHILEKVSAPVLLPSLTSQSFFNRCRLMFSIPFSSSTSEQTWTLHTPTDLSLVSFGFFTSLVFSIIPVYTNSTRMKMQLEQRMRAGECL